MHPMVFVMPNEVAPQYNAYGEKLKRVRPDKPKLTISANSRTTSKYILGVVFKHYSSDLDIGSNGSETDTPQSTNHMRYLTAQTN
jgi:hypothetical protein